MSDLAQAIRDAIEALKTPAPREIIAEQLQRALDAGSSSSQQMTASNPFPRLRALSGRLQDPASRRPEYAASLLSSVREEVKEILEDIRMLPSRESDAREALAEAKKSLIAAGLGSCTCITKTPELAYHAADCRYLKIASALESIEFAATALRQPAASGGEICPMCCGSGYSNHPDSGEICSACEGQGGKPPPSDERAKVIEECAQELFNKIGPREFVSRCEARRIVRALSQTNVERVIGNRCLACGELVNFGHEFAHKKDCPKRLTNAVAAEKGR